MLYADFMLFKPPLPSICEHGDNDKNERGMELEKYEKIWWMDQLLENTY